MENIQGKVNLEKPTQEQIKPVFDIWNSDITSTEDFKTRVGKTRDYLREFDCEDIWNFRFNNSEDLGTLVLKNILKFIYDQKHEDSTTQVKDMFKLLEENDISPIKNLSQDSQKYVETSIIYYGRPSFANKIGEENIKREERLIEFIETVGLFKDLSEENTLDFAKNVVASNSTHLLKWLFSRGLSPDTKIEQINDKWPLASLSPTMDMLNVFISHGANLALTSKNGVAFSKLLSKRTKSFHPFATVKDHNQIVSTIYKAEMATQINSQEHLWRLIKEAEFNVEAITAVKIYKNACDLRDEKGHHIVQFAMLHNPICVDAILSVNKKTLALGTTPDMQGRLPSVYWIANGNAQYIQKTDKTTVLIPKRIDEETWRQAAELTYELELEWVGICSYKVQKIFEETTGKKLNKWIEEEAANGSQWFEHVVDIAVKRAKKGLPSPFFLYSDAIETWSDPDNPRVVNEAHALFRAHLMCANYFAHDNDIKKQNLKNFLKTHLSGKTFDTLKGQINNGVSFMSDYNYKLLIKSQWWKETCAIIERENLFKKHLPEVDTGLRNKFAVL